MNTPPPRPAATESCRLKCGLFGATYGVGVRPLNLLLVTTLPGSAAGAGLVAGKTGSTWAAFTSMKTAGTALMTLVREDVP